MRPSCDKYATMQSAIGTTFRMCRPLSRTAFGLVSVALWPNWALAQSDVASEPAPNATPTASASSVSVQTAPADATSGGSPVEAQAPSSTPGATAQAPASEPGTDTASTTVGASSAASTPLTTQASVQSSEGSGPAEEPKGAEPAEPVSDAEPDDGRSKASLGDDEPSVKNKPEVDVGLRVIGGFRYRKRELDEDATYGFQARQVRASFKLKLGKRLHTRLSAEFTDGIGTGSGIRFLRTAVLEYRQSKALRLAVGRFKRPFSYLQLQSTSDLPVLDRGLLNELVVEDSAWGDRGIGAMASGKIKAANFSWAFALTNPSPDNLSTQGIDAIARVAWTPIDLFTVGVNGGNKYLDFAEGRQHYQALGGDVTLHVGGLEWQLEGAVADRPWHKTLAFGGTSLLSYTQRLSKHWQVQPVVFAEYADANAEFGRNESLRLQAGINAIVRDQLRIMPQYKLTTPIGEPLLSAPASSPEYKAINPWAEGYELSLMISLVL